MNVFNRSKGSNPQITLDPKIVENIEAADENAIEHKDELLSNVTTSQDENTNDGSFRIGDGVQESHHTVETIPGETHGLRAHKTQSSFTPLQNKEHKTEHEDNEARSKSFLGSSQKNIEEEVPQHDPKDDQTEPAEVSNTQPSESKDDSLDHEATHHQTLISEPKEEHQEPEIDEKVETQEETVEEISNSQNHHDSTTHAVSDHALPEVHKDEATNENEKTEEIDHQEKQAPEAVPEEKHESDTAHEEPVHVQESIAVVEDEKVTHQEEQ